MWEATVEAHLATLRRPDIDAAVRPLTCGLVLPEAMRMMRGVLRRRRLTVPTLVRVRPPRPPLDRADPGAYLPHSERYADRVEFAYVDDAAHFITDDAHH